MRFIYIGFLMIVVMSCSGTKKVITDNSNTTQDIVNQTETVALRDSISVKRPVLEEKSSIQKDTVSSDLSPYQTVSKRELTLHQLWDELLKLYVSESGDVDYAGIKSNYNDLAGYVYLLKMSEPLETASRNEKLAYWINAYNAFTVDLIIRNCPLESIKDIKDPWEQRLWQIGDKWINLNEIEHKILRKMNEPRIHFAIVCASESCPKLLNEAFTAENLEAQLTKATKLFLSDTSKNEISENDIKLSKIFKWFAKDFKTNGSLVEFLNQYSDVNISEKAKKSYKDYDWSLNN